MHLPEGRPQWSDRDNLVVRSGYFIVSTLGRSWHGYGMVKYCNNNIWKSNIQHLILILGLNAFEIPGYSTHG